jgi:hypothetical protein
MNSLSRSVIIVLVLLSVYSCAKKDDTTSPSASTTGSNPQPSITSYSVNGVAANSPIPGTSTLGGNFAVIATDPNSYPETQLKITFSGTNTPISGPYSILNSASGPFQCSFLLTSTTTVTTTAPASIGTVTVTAAATPNNLASFSNIICTNTGTTTTNYTVSGTIKY